MQHISLQVTHSTDQGCIQWLLSGCRQSSQPRHEHARCPAYTLLAGTHVKEALNLHSSFTCSRLHTVWLSTACTLLRSNIEDSGRAPSHSITISATVSTCPEQPNLECRDLLPAIMRHLMLPAIMRHLMLPAIMRHLMLPACCRRTSRMPKAAGAAPRPVRSRSWWSRGAQCQQTLPDPCPCSCPGWSASLFGTIGPASCSGESGQCCPCCSALLAAEALSHCSVRSYTLLVSCFSPAVALSQRQMHPPASSTCSAVSWPVKQDLMYAADYSRVPPLAMLVSVQVVPGDHDHSPGALPAAATPVGAPALPLAVQSIAHSAAEAILHR